MKSTLKRIFASLLVSAMLVSAVACSTDNGGDTSADTSNSTDSSTDTNTNEDSNSDESYSFTFYLNGSWTAYPLDGQPGKEIMQEAMTAYGLPNIDFEVTHIGGTEYYDRLNVLAVSDSLPDAMGIDLTTVKSFADQDLILPLDDHIDSLTNLKDLMRQPEIDAATYNGSLYAFPVGYLEGSINGPNTNGLVIRQDWLDNVGMEVPTTIDEMYEVMKAFKEQDPDGNGEDDTFGYLGVDTTWFDVVFGAYGIQPTFWMETEDGLRMGSTLDGTQEALATLRKWYEEGLIDPDIFVSDASLKDQKFANSKGGIYEGSGFTGSPVNPESAALLSVTPTAVLSPIGAITGPDGESGKQESKPGYGNLRAISKSAENVDVLVEFMNWTVSYEENGGAFLCSVGVEGEDFTIDTETDLILQTSTYDEIYGKGLGNPVRFLQAVDRRWLNEDAVGFFDTFEGTYEENMYWGTTDAMLDYPDTSEELFRQYMARIILGELPVEAWSDYVDEFYSMGGDIIEQEVNEAYNNLNS